MLKPSMTELMKKVGNRYLLVNLAAQRARDISDDAKDNEEQLPDKAVKLALDEIAAGTIVYRPGPKAEEVIETSSYDLSGAMLDLDLDSEDDAVELFEEDVDDTEEE